MQVQAAAGSETASQLLDQARVAAEEDHHKQAIDLYQGAIAADRSLRAAVATELGHQYTWAEMPESAMDWYEIAMREDPGNMDANLGMARALAWAGRHQASERRYLAMLPASGARRNEVLVGLAKVTSWQGDLGQAESIYSEVLKSDPENMEAHLGMAEVTNWSGRHHEAETLYSHTLASEPQNNEARIGLAWAQHWSGRSQQALQTLRSGGGHTDLEKAARDIRGDGRVRGANRFSFRDNSTDGDFYQFESSLFTAPTLGTEVTFSYARGRLTVAGSPDIDRDQLSVVIQKRLSAVAAVTVSPGVQLNRFDTVTLAPGNLRNNEFNLFVWDVYATLTPSDWVRLDIGNSRQTLVIPQTTFLEIDVTETTAGLDWRLHHRFATFWTLKYSAYSDDNSRFAVSQRVDWTPRITAAGRWKNAFVLSQGIEYWDFQKQLDNGYFSPLTYAHVFGAARFAHDLSPRVRTELMGRIGVEKEAGQDWTNVGSFEVSVRIKTAWDLFIGAGYSGSGSRLDSPDGFRSRNFFVSVDYGLGR